MTVQTKPESTSLFVIKNTPKAVCKNTEPVWYTVNDKRITTEATPQSEYAPMTRVYMSSDIDRTTNTVNTTNIRRADDDVKTETDYTPMASTYIQIAPSVIDLDTPLPMEYTFMFHVRRNRNIHTHNDERKIMGNHQHTSNKDTTTSTKLSQLSLSQYGPHTLSRLYNRGVSLY